MLLGKNSGMSKTEQKRLQRVRILDKLQEAHEALRGLGFEHVVGEYFWYVQDRTETSATGETTG